MKTCKTCEWLYKEHCVNGESENCTEPVSENYGCENWEEVKNEKDKKDSSTENNSN